MSRLCLSWPLLPPRSEEHTSELQSPGDLVCRLLLEKKKESIQNRATCAQHTDGPVQRERRDRVVNIMFVILARTPRRIDPSTILAILFFFFNDTATTEIYPLSLHDALPICGCGCGCGPPVRSRHGVGAALTACAAP